MVRIVIIQFLFFFISSCSINRFPYDVEGLTYKNKFVFSNTIKLNGYFYKLHKSGINIHYFFEDGYYLMDGSPLKEEINNPICYQVNEKSRNVPFDWGVFIIEGDTLKLQRVAAYGRDKYKKFMVEELWAKIEDGGNLLRYFRKKDIDGNVSKLNDEYRFHPCSKKPSSTNILMIKTKK